jgi:hypothetical protein
MSDKLPDSFVVDRFIKSYPTEIGSQPFEPDNIDLFRLDKTNNLKNHYLAKFEELKKQYISVMEDIKTNERLYKAKYSFQPIVGQNYYLYSLSNKEDFLSIISPREWGTRKFNLIGMFQLQTDGRWFEVKE